MASERPIIIATRGSALALAQAKHIAENHQDHRRQIADCLHGEQG
jgi:porphobilinogen deaminase